MFYIGVDLGQRQDHSAIAVVQKDPGTGLLMARLARRIPLGTPYAEVVSAVERVVDKVRAEGRCSVTVDATGVGAPVIEMLREARLGCEICAVTITGGDVATPKPGGWNVPKADLMSGLQVALESGRLRIASELREVDMLLRELVDVRASTGVSGRVRMGADGAGEHDDLVIALALACWKAGRALKKIGFGTRPLF